MGTAPTATHSATLLQERGDQSGKRRRPALVSMALPQGQADGSLPAGDPSPSEGTPGPSRAPASPAANRRRALLKELEAQVQAAYGQVKGTGCGAPEGAAGIPRRNRDPVGQTQDRAQGGAPGRAGGRQAQSAAQDGGWRLSPPLPSPKPASSPQHPELSPFRSSSEYRVGGLVQAEVPRAGRLARGSKVRARALARRVRSFLDRAKTASSQDRR